MSIYDHTTRTGKPVNPVRALYNHWFNLLSQMPQTERDHTGKLVGESNYGDGWWKVGFHHDYGALQPDLRARPPIRYGGGFILHPDGTFKMTSYHGWKQRDVLAQHTFMRWNYVHGQYVWHVQLDAKDGGYRGDRLKNWHEKILYMPEVLLAGPDWARPGPLLRLEWDSGAGQWEIVFHAETSRSIAHSAPINQVDFNNFTALREKRYERYEREYLRSIGALPPAKHRVEVTDEERDERKEQAVQVLVAHLNISQSARSVPLRKSDKEEGLWPAQPGCP